MKNLSLLLIMVFSFLNSLRADTLDIGASLPDLTVTLEDATQATLSEFSGDDYTLVFFYPKANTSGCTAQACSLRDAYEQLQELGVTILGVSKDGVEAQAAFKNKRNLPFHLVSDTDAEVIKAFGVPTNFGFAARQAFLFKDGILVWRDLSASTTRQASDVIEQIKPTSTPPS